MLVSVKWRLISPVASLQLKPGHPPSSSPLLLFLPSPQQPSITGFTTQLVVLVAPKRSWSNALRPAPSGARLGLLCPLSPLFHSTLSSTRCRRRRLTVLCKAFYCPIGIDTRLVYLDLLCSVACDSSILPLPPACSDQRLRLSLNPSVFFPFSLTYRSSDRPRPVCLDRSRP